MELRLVRQPSTLQSTSGELFVDGTWQAFTLEDVVRPKKIFGITAIPQGRYHVALTHSPRFNRVLPLVEHVPDFDGVRIHAGNHSSDTEGCVLVGRQRGANCVMESRLALAELMAKLEPADDIWLTIEDAK